MSKKRAKKAQQVLLSLAGLLVVSYFIYHTIQGDRGFFALLRLERDVASATDRYNALKAERDELEHKTKLLNAKSLDPDLLEEKSRELLNYAKPNEIIILAPQAKEDPAKAIKNEGRSLGGR